MKKNHHFSIPEPCHEDWNKMSPTEKGRFCDSCAKEVKDFSRSTSDEIAQTILSSSAQVCGRFRKDQLSNPLPKLIELIPKKQSQVAAAAAAALALFSCDIGVSQGAADIRGNIAYSQDINESQTERVLRGIVLDDDGEPLPFANVHFQTDQGVPMGVHTDVEGLFEIHIAPHELKGDELILVTQYLGYNSREMNVILKGEMFVQVKLDDVGIYLAGLVVGQVKAEPNSNEIIREFERVKDWAEEAKRIQETIVIEDIIGDVEIEGDWEEEELITKGEVLLKPEQPVECHFEIGRTQIDEAIEELPEIETILIGDTIIVELPDTLEIDQPGTNNESAAQIIDELKTEARTSIDVADFSLFPNPSSDILNVKMDNDNISEYAIVDARGSTVIRGKAVSPTMEIDISNLENGNYFFLMIQDGDEILSRQFIVAH